MKVIYFATIVVLFLCFSACHKDDVLVTEDKRMAVFATLLDSNNVALQDLPVNVTTKVGEENNVLGASHSKALGKVDFVSLVAYNRGIVVNFNPLSSGDHNPNFMSLSYVDPREFMDREEIMNFDLVKLNPIQDVDISIDRLPETDSVEFRIQYYNTTQFISLDEENNPIGKYQNTSNTYERLDEETASFQNSYRLPVGSPIKILYTVNDEAEKDTTITVTSAISTIDLDF